MKGLVLYYSYSGNTEKVAKMIQRATGFDIAEIKPVKNYEGDYNSVVNQGKKEVDNRVEPEIVDLKCDLSQYDTVVLGSPVWWYTLLLLSEQCCREIIGAERLYILLQQTAGGLATPLKI